MTTPARGGRYLLGNRRGRIIVVGSGGDARNVGAIDADIGQLAVAELRQLSQVPVVLAEGVNHPNDGKHKKNMVVS